MEHPYPQDALLENTFDMLNEMRHDLNNPLAIISGNVQFLLEIARGEDYETQIAEPLRDIKQASQQITKSLDELEKLKDDLQHDASR